MWFLYPCVSNHCFIYITLFYRLDEDQATKRNSNQILNQYGGGQNHPDYYEFEVHIMFDDAMKMNHKKEWAINDFVVSFVKTVNAAAR